MVQVLVYERRSRDCPMKEGRDFWLQDEMATADAQCEVVWREAEEPLFLLYTSGSTGKPKGVVHSTGGYMVYAATTTKYVFDLTEDDVFWYGRVWFHASVRLQTPVAPNGMLSGLILSLVVLTACTRCAGGAHRAGGGGGGAAKTDK